MVTTTKAGGRTALVDVPSPLIALPLPPLPIAQVDLEVDIQVVYRK